ncbi:MAG: 50S ribosomal protein L35 [Desulfobacteraceae bacterium]|nr:50S ribosomal protein L35 [Desulfobacteraceae bacterium]
MRKLKTKRSAAKRFKTTGTGKFVSNRPCKSHLLTHKSRKRKRNLRKDVVVSSEMTSALKRMMPYL